MLFSNVSGIVEFEFHPYFVIYLPVQLLECVRIWGGISLFHGYDPMVRKENCSLLNAPRRIRSNVSNKILYQFIICTYPPVRSHMPHAV